MRVSDKGLRAPEAMRPIAEEVFKLTDAFCTEHLDAECGELCRKLTAKLARKRPSPVMRGDLRIWAGAVIYTIGSMNFLFDRTQQPHMTGDQLSSLTGVPKSTMTNKAKVIRDTLKLRRVVPEFCRRELLTRHSLAWMMFAKGVVVDAWTLEAEIQAEARRRGLIPDAPISPRKDDGQE